MGENNDRPLILVTNDDGIEAKGFNELIRISREFGEVVAISGTSPMSGMSHAITVKVPLRVELVEEEQGLKKYLTSGTPVDGVKLAFNSLMHRRPDLLLSGINHGSNSSSSILYSGTMAAAMEGAVNHVPSVGFSLLSFDPEADFGPSAGVVRNVVTQVLSRGLPEGICLNVNIPAVPEEAIRGLLLCRQANGYWKEKFEQRTDPSGKKYYWLTGHFQNREPGGAGEGTDEWALKNLYVSVVPINTDMTAHGVLEQMKAWGLSTIRHETG